MPGYKKNKKKYEENATLCILCQEVEPTCKVNCIHNNKSQEYLKKVEKLNFFRCSRCDVSAHFDCMIQEIKKRTNFLENKIVKYIKSGKYIIHKKKKKKNNNNNYSNYLYLYILYML